MTGKTKCDHYLTAEIGHLKHRQITQRWRDEMWQRRTQTGERNKREKEVSATRTTSSFLGEV